MEIYVDFHDLALMELDHSIQWYLFTELLTLFLFCKNSARSPSKPAAEDDPPKVS